MGRRPYVAETNIAPGTACVQGSSENKVRSPLTGGGGSFIGVYAYEAKEAKEAGDALGVAIYGVAKVLAGGDVNAGSFAEIKDESGAFVNGSGAGRVCGMFLQNGSAGEYVEMFVAPAPAGGGGSGGGGVDQDARDGVAALQSSKQDNLPAMNVNHLNKLCYLKGVFNQNNAPLYRDLSWVELSGIAQFVTPDSPPDMNNANKNLASWISACFSKSPVGWAKINGIDATWTNIPADFAGVSSIIVHYIKLTTTGTAGTGYTAEGTVTDYATGKTLYFKQEYGGGRNDTVSLAFYGGSAGMLSDLQTADKTSVVAAINALKARIDALESP
jgi:hypothetical protein